jgi:quercetin dioxygenase-like cupin family protein
MTPKQFMELAMRYQTLVLLLALALPAAAGEAPVRISPTPAAAAPAATVKPAFRQTIANLPGKSMVAVTVEYPPGVKSASHRHAASAFIMAYVLEGEIRSQVDNEPVRVYRAGESWHEQPGAHHRVSENASATKSAKLLAVFVMDSGETALTVPDKP